jgi:hypothetical protein
VGVLKPQTIFGPQLFKAVNKVFNSTSWFPWYKSFSLTCKAQRKFQPFNPEFLFKKAFRVLSSRNILPKYGAEGAQGGGAGRSGSDGRVCHRRYAQIQEPELWKGPAAVVGAL